MSSRAPYLFRTPEKSSPPLTTETVTHEEDETEGNDDSEKFLCRNCFQTITYPSDRIHIHGAHTHTFANPYGLVFDIGCFRAAPGCRHTGRITDEFTWFKGYSWKIALCGKCLTQIGWFFTSHDAGGFYGLILEKLLKTGSAGL